MFKLPLRIRVTLIIFVLQAIVLGIVLNETLSRYYDGTISQLSTVENSILEVTGELTRTSLFAGDYEILQTYFERLKNNPMIDDVLLADDKQTIVASVNPDLIGETFVVPQGDGSTVWQYLKLSNIAEQLGTLAIQFSNTPLNRLHDQIVSMAINWSIIGLLSIFLISLVTGYLLTLRLSRITTAATSVAEGNLNIDLNIRGNDEIAKLARVFKQMVSRLGNEQERLESLVKQRTVELTASNQELQAFSYSVSHDLRAPLRAISGFTKAITEECEALLDEQGKFYFERVLVNTQRMSDLIDAMLSLSRITRRELKQDLVDMSNLARVVFQQYLDNDKNRSVTISLEDGIMGCGDPELLRIVFENLIDNAWKYTRETSSPRIEFGKQYNTDHTVYYVRDSGCGFDPRYAHKLFDPFQRAHNSEFEGLGIGLATVKRIILRHDGEVWAESKIGHGTTFYFTLANRNMNIESEDKEKTGSENNGSAQGSAP
jgi:signal transduction histidine kinase